MVSGQISSKMTRGEFSIFIKFSVHVYHIITLLNYYIIGQISAKWLGENSIFLFHFLIHIHVLMLCRKFELIPIKIGIFYEFLKLLQNWAKVPVLIVHGLGPNFVKNEKERILHFYNFF